MAGAGLNRDSLNERFRQAGNIQWADVRASGRLGVLYAAAFLASGALGLFDWMFPGHQAGCTAPQSNDPRYFCPTDAHVVSIWLLVGVTTLGGFLGSLAIRTRRKRLLVAMAAIQLVVLGTLIWIALDPSFHVHLR